MGGNAGWGSDWSHVVPGEFDGDSYTDLLLYDERSGTAQFHVADGRGGTSLLRDHTWDSGWSHVVPGEFDGDGHTDLFCYDRQTGEAEFRVADGQGGTTPLGSPIAWQTGWSHVVPGDFNGDGLTDLLVYDDRSGAARFHATDGEGGIQSLGRQATWQRGWSHVVPGDFGGDGHTDLLLYNERSGAARFYTTDGRGGITPLGGPATWRVGWAEIVPCRLGGDEHTDLLLYDDRTGEAQFYTTDGVGSISSVGQHRFPANLSAVASGAFDDDDADELLTYDRPQGTMAFFDATVVDPIILDHPALRRFGYLGGMFTGSAQDDVVQLPKQEHTLVDIDPSWFPVVDWDFPDPEEEDADSERPPVAEGEVRVELSKEPTTSEETIEETEETVRNDYVCSSIKKRVTAANQDTLLLDPTSDVIYPGAVLDGGSIDTGEYTPISAKRAPMTLSISLNEGQLKRGEDPYIVVQEPSVSKVRDAVNKLRARKADGPSPAKMGYMLKEITTEDQLKAELGAHYKSAAAEFEANLDYSDESTTNKLLLEFTQEYYTIDMDTPNTGLFAEPREIADDEVYVASMTYGRTLLVTIESEESMRDLKAAATVIGKQYGASASTEVSRTLNEAKITVLAIGGSSDAAVEVITDGVSGINGYIEKGKDYSSKSPASPLSYKLRFVDDNSVANVLLSSVYTQRNCVKTTGTFDVTNIGIKAHTVHDPGKNEEIYGEITVSWSARDDEGVLQLGSERAWKVDRDRHVSLGEGQRKRVGRDVRVKFANFPETRDSAQITVKAEIREKDLRKRKDDYFGTRSQPVYLDSLKPSGDAEKGSQSEGAYVMKFQDQKSEVSVSFDVIPR